jgi:hypothetical protein
MSANRGAVAGSKRGIIALVAMAFVAMVTAWAFPNVARADIVIGSSGSGTGQHLQARGVAVDYTEDLLYVADTGNNRVDVFDASTGAFVKAFGWGVADGVTNALQVCTTTCFKGIKGTGAGQFSGLVGIAVDNDPASAGYHSIYTFENEASSSPENLRVQKLTPTGDFVWMTGGEVNKTTNANLCTASSGDVCGAGRRGDAEGHFNPVPLGGVVAVGPGGTIHVGDQLRNELETRIQRYAPSGTYLGQQKLTVDGQSGASGNVTGMAVDSAGNVYVGTDNVAGAVRKYDPSGVQLFKVNPSFNINSVAVGEEDHFFVNDNSSFSPDENEGNSSILEYDSTGELVRVFYGSLEARATGLAPYSGPNGDIFAAEEGSSGKPARVLHIPFPPPGPIVYPRPRSIFASPIGNTKATLNAKVNPEGEATTYHFEYITDEDFKAAGETFGAGTLKTPESASVGSDFNLHLAETQVTGLFPETLYHFRAVAKNASGEAIGPAGSFVTKQPLEFGDLWSAGVDTDSATLHAELNPFGIPATARFQYVELAEFEATGYANAKEAPAPPADPIDLGEGEEMKEVSVSIGGLKEGTSYRYRIVAINRCKPAPAPLCEFAEPEATFTTFVTLDPITGCPNDQFRQPALGEFLPNCRAYEMVSPVDKKGANVEPAVNVSTFPAGLDQAASDGDSVTYSSYKAFGDVATAPYTNQYLARREAGTGWVSEGISPHREGPSLMMYLSAALDRQYKAFSPDLCSGWVVQDARPVLAPGGIDGYAGLYRRDNCGSGTGDYETLTTIEAPATTPPNLPPRKFIPELQGTSADGSVGVFSVNDNLTADAPAQPQACVEETNPSTEACEARVYEARGEQLNYVCVLPGEAPYAGGCSAGTSSGGTTGRFGNVFNAISDDGSRIFWTASGSGPGKLYVRIDGSQPSAETIEISSSSSTQFWGAAADGSTAIYSVGENLSEFDVDAEAATPIAGGVKGVAGTSEDASRVYFVSTQVLTGETANSEGAKAQAGKPNLYLYEAGSDFRFIATLDDADLQSSSQPSSPVAKSPPARLSRITPSGEQIVFMSLAPITGYDNTDAETGETDMEVFLYGATANGGAGEVLCPSCNPSGARPEGRKLTQKLLDVRRAAAWIPTAISQLYAPRVISDDGTRLYFNSFESLVSIDTNDAEDVYQWEAVGAGDCTAQSQTYHSNSGGCVDLISTGKSQQGSELTDISSDGRDVFFKTWQSILPQDPGQLDIYDARIGGGFPPLPQPPIVCSGDACQQPNPTPPATSPATAVVRPGNPPSSKPPRPCPKGKHKVKKKGKVRCVKNKRGKQQGKKRAGKNGGTAR